MLKRNQTFTRSTPFFIRVVWILTITAIVLLSGKSNPGNTNYDEKSIFSNFYISSELASMSDRLCLLWTSTHDRVFRKYNFPLKNYHRYGLQFNNNHSQLFLLILLAGDVALNPGPTINLNHTSDLKLNQLNALYLNARSLKAFVPADNDSSSKVCKITLLQHLVYSGSYDLICICETWLNESVLSSELLPGYSIFRCDRVGKIGGGVLVAIKSNIRAIRRIDLEREDVELVVVEFTTQCNKTTILYTFYRPPNSCPDVIQHLNTSLQSNPESSNIILIGDFNLPAIDWSLNQQTPATNGGQLEESFCDLIEDNFLQQYISGSTHKDGNKLDLLLCNCPEIIKNVSSLPPDQLCFPTDHHIIEFGIQQSFCRAKSVTRTIFDYRRGNFDELRSYLTRNPCGPISSDDINTCWSQWKEWFLHAVQKFIPIKKVKDKNSPPWIDGEVIYHIRKKYAALKKYRKTRTEYCKRKLRKISQTVKYLVKRKHQNYLLKIRESFRNNPKLFWSYHKAVFHHRSSQNAMISHNNIVAKTPTKKAELFNSYFSSVFQPSTSKTNDTADSRISRLPTDLQLSDITLDVEEVINSLTNLDVSKAGGPDGIPARLLKECSRQIAPSLCSLFNDSLRSGHIPSEWKSADVTPVHKKNSKNEAANYRPISLLPIISKTLERCIYWRFYNHVEHFISPSQHGFLRNRSCVTQLLSSFHSIGHDLDTNTQTDILYMDFAKAFDSVDHNILLEKLRCYGVTGSVFDWFADYLSGRTQRVVVDGVASDWCSVTSGVPQGSILGPVLFIIFINDLPDIIHTGTKTALYADDTKLHRNIFSARDCDSLQESLVKLDSWSMENKLFFNASKCKVLTITRKKNPVIYEYTLGSKKLTRVDHEKDLGIMTTTNITWDLHVNTVVAKANKMLGILKRTCTSITDITIRRTLYLSLVKSQLLYASEVWSPVNNVKLAKRVEKVQRRATKWILMNGDITYKERLLSLNLLPLSYDREIKDLTFFYKALFGFVNVDLSNFVSFVNHGRTRLSRSSDKILQTPLCKTTTFQSSYYNRIVKIWNTVTQEVSLESFSRPSSFKCYLKRKYLDMIDSNYDVDKSCTWSLIRDCPCHRS